MSQALLSQPPTGIRENATFAPQRSLTPTKDMYSQEAYDSLKRALSLSQELDSDAPNPKRHRGFDPHEDLVDIFGELAFLSQDPAGPAQLPGAPKRPSHREPVERERATAIPRRLPMQSQSSQSQSSQPFETDQETIFELRPVPCPGASSTFNKLLVPRQEPSSVLRNIIVLGRNVETGITDRCVSRHQAEVYVDADSGQVVIKASSPKPTVIRRGASGVEEVLRENESATLDAGDTIELLRSKYTYEVVARRQESDRRISR